MAARWEWDLPDVTTRGAGRLLWRMSWLGVVSRAAWHLSPLIVDHATSHHSPVTTRHPPHTTHHAPRTMYQAPRTAHRSLPIFAVGAARTRHPY